MDTLTNVGIGGAANVAIDYVWEQIEALAAYDQYKHIAKIVGGAVVGGMVSNKYARAAADGVATVGVSNLIASLIDTEATPEPKAAADGSAGLPGGTIGRMPRYGRRAARARVAGLNDFME